MPLSLSLRVERGISYRMAGAESWRLVSFFPLLDSLLNRALTIALFSFSDFDMAHAGVDSVESG